MLYPAELQALPQPRGVTVAQGFSLCLGRMLKSSASGVLASFRSSTYPRGYASGLHSLRPCWTNLLSILLGSRETGGKSATGSSEHFSPQPSVFRLPDPSRFSRMSHESRGVKIRRAGILLLQLIRWLDEALPGRRLPLAPGDLLPLGMWRGAARSG